MKTFLTILSGIFVCLVGHGTTIVPTNYVRVTPTSAAGYGISLSCSPTNDSVILVMPYAEGDLTFYCADLALTNSFQHFNIPLKEIHVSDVEGKTTQGWVLIGFWMDRRTLRESSLQITFRKNIEKGTVYMISPKDLVPSIAEAGSK